MTVKGEFKFNNIKTAQLNNEQKTRTRHRYVK